MVSGKLDLNILNTELEDGVVGLCGILKKEKCYIVDKIRPEGFMYSPLSHLVRGRCYIIDIFGTIRLK